MAITYHYCIFIAIDFWQLIVVLHPNFAKINSRPNIVARAVQKLKRTRNYIVNCTENI